jgi:hypothetical protein
MSVEVEIGLGKITVLFPVDVTTLIYQRLKKYTLLDNGTYKCPQCHSAIKEVEIRLPLWNSIMPGACGSGDVITTPPIPFCPNCDPIPWKEQETSLAPRGSYFNPEPYPDPCWVMINRKGEIAYPAIFSNKDLAQGYTRELNMKKHVEIIKLSWDEVVDRFAGGNRNLNWIVVDPMWRILNSSMVRLQKKT